VAAIFLGAILGGLLGERWHTKLARRAADPNFGPAADLRRQAEREDAERDRRLEQDEAVRRDATADGFGRDDDNVDLTDDGREERLTYSEWRAREQQLQTGVPAEEVRPR
jgi:hypothetical protein